MNTSESKISTLEKYAKKQFLNLETFRKNGEGMKTPVWFVQDGDLLYVQTLANSGKVKRIKNNNMVMIAPCKVDGTPIGIWQPATSHEVNDPETVARVDRLLNIKYGLQKRLFSISNNRKRVKNTVLEIKLD